MPVPSFEPVTSDVNDNLERIPDATDVDREYLEVIRSIHNSGEQENISQTPEGFLKSSTRPEAPIDSQTVKQILASSEADTLLREYRQMSATFPFVVISPDVKSVDLHAERPMLFLAIITVASWKDHSRQKKLDSVYRTELANRTIISPKRTLGLVQSVLVYLSWYHFVFSHKTQQIFFLHHLVIGLALDIGLHQDYQPLGFSTPRRPPPPPSAKVLRERYRAFLGCYYLASMVAAGFQKPNILKHTPAMAEWAQALKQDHEYESDEIIQHLTSLRQIDDQIQDALFTADAKRLSLADAGTLMHIRFMETQLDSWKKNISGVRSQRLLGLSFSFTKMLLHSVALRPQPKDQDPSVISTQLNSLNSALEAGKHFLNTLLSFPVHEYHLISFTEWMRLPTVIGTVAKLCMPSDAHVASSWDVQTAQERVRLDLCLESLCYRMQTLTAYHKRENPHTDFWYAMCFIMELTKSWYVRKIQPAEPAQTQPEPTPNGSTDQSVNNLSCPISGTAKNHPTPRAETSYDRLGGSDYMGDINMDIAAGNDDGNDPFAFLKDMDFDMEQFFDMDGGIWGDESYNSYSALGLDDIAPF
ncbi:Fungal-trans domain containing protein [Pyrenophora tritici-repentis]|nr:Fungal-trans domain containing protein [Pyrenophora tritici-repentis]